MNNKIKKKSPVKFGWVTAALAVAGYLSSKKQERRARRDVSAAQAEFEEQLQIYKDSRFQPIDPDIVDQENIFEDMEVDTTTFEMQRKAFLQQQANILQSLQTVGGTSGAAGLATALSMSAEQQAEKATMTTAQMLNRAKELRLQEQGRINQAVTNVELANAEGARQFEIDKLNTLLGVSGQKVAGARQGLAGARSATNSLVAGMGSAAGSYFGAGGKVDLSKPF